MNRILIVAVFTVLPIAATAEAQSWMFQPGTYSKTGGSQAPESTTGPAVPFSGTAYGLQASDATAGPHAYATFTETQAAAAAQLPKPAFRWDPTGLRGRMMQYQSWSHEEAMEANRLRTYAQGVRDAVGAPIWTWNGASPQPLPRIVAPTPASPGKTKSPPIP